MCDWLLSAALTPQWTMEMSLQCWIQKKKKFAKDQLLLLLSYQGGWEQAPCVTREEASSAADPAYLLFWELRRAG